MQNQTDRMRRMEYSIEHEFKAAFLDDLITETEYNNYMAELKALTAYIYEQQKGQLAFNNEDWNKINDYYEYIRSLDFVRDRIKKGLEYTWLIER